MTDLKTRKEACLARIRSRIRLPKIVAPLSLGDQAALALRDALNGSAPELRRKTDAQARQRQLDCAWTQSLAASLALRSAQVRLRSGFESV